MRAKVPVTVISGFLGSGKTTLLNHILTRPHGLKIAVLINEFGELGIDGRLVVSSDRDMVELNNGCICCTMNEGLIAALHRIRNNGKPFDYLVIETTGIADPRPVAMTFVRPEFQADLRLDSILTVVDAENFDPGRFEDPAARNQIRFADCLLLNKTDLVAEPRLQEVERRLRKINPQAKILRTLRCEVALPLVLGVGGSGLEAVETGESAHTCTPDCHHQGEGHSHGFQTFAQTLPQEIHAERFQKFLEGLPAEVFRAKGFLRVSGSDTPYLFHLVGRRFTLEPMPPQAQEPARLVFIGTKLDRSGLQRGLEGCLVAAVSGT
jgi:G3E family GTPase